MKKLVFGFLLTILIGCNNQNNSIQEKQCVEVVEENRTHKSLKVDTDVSFVQLETTDECLIEYIMNIEIIDNYIYILDRNSFNIFTKAGKFIKKTKRGRGPGELTRALNFSIDKERNEIYIIEMGNLLHVYDNIANYKETHKLDGSFIDVMRLNDDNFILFTVLPSKYEDFLISIYNISSKTITNKLISYDDIPMKDLSILTYNNFFVNNDEIFFSASNSRNIYRYAGDSMQTVYSIDFKELEPPVSYMNRFDNVRSFSKMAYNDDYVGFFNFSYNFNKFLLIGLEYKDFNCGIKHKDEEIMYLSSTYELFDLPQTSSFKRPDNATGNQLHFVYYNDILLSDDLQKEEMILEIGDKSIQVVENNNPIIVTLTIKE